MAEEEDLPIFDIDVLNNFYCWSPKLLPASRVKLLILDLPFRPLSHDVGDARVRAYIEGTLPQRDFFHTARVKMCIESNVP